MILGSCLSPTGRPPPPFLPPERYGTPALGLVLSWAGDIAKGQEVLAPLRRLGSPPGDLVSPVPYRALQTLLDGAAAPANGAHWRSIRLPAFSDTAIELLVSLVDTLPTPQSFLNGWAIGGALSRVVPETTAVGLPEVDFELRIIAMWPPKDPNAAQHIAWVNNACKQAAAHSTADEHLPIGRQCLPSEE
jgi:hypothetical protein